MWKYPELQRASLSHRLLIKILKQATGKVGSRINRKKTKIMKLLKNEKSADDGDDEDVDFEKVIDSST